MEGFPRSKSWPRKSLKLGTDVLDWKLGPTWSNLQTVDAVGAEGVGSLSDYNNAILFWARDHLAKALPEGSTNFSQLADIGGSFRLSQVINDYSGLAIRHDSSVWSGIPIRWTGPLVPTGNSYLEVGPPAVTPLDTSALNFWGTAGVARAAPTNPLFDAGTFVGELRQIPSLPGRSLFKKGLKGTGDEYLNVEFGINPILRDANTIRETAIAAENFLNQLAAKSGKYTRRQRLLQDTKTVTEEVVSNNLQSNFAIGPDSSFPLKRTYTQHQKIWFSGSFCYFYQLHPNESDFLRRMRYAKDVFGLDLSLEVGWNLLPFSWLADWVSNIGDITHNLTRFSQDGLVMKYGYVMCHTINTYEYTYGPSRWTISNEVKQRARANPFGFGIVPANLSDRQWAILAALGQIKFWR